MVENPFWEYWYYHIPNYVIAALIYTMIGRLLLSFFVPPDWNNYIWRFFRQLTDPVLAAVDRITPRFVHPAFLPAVAIFWLFVLRIAWWVILWRLGLAPVVALTAPSA